jgi:hypothetical protein
LDASRPGAGKVDQRVEEPQQAQRVAMGDIDGLAIPRKGLFCRLGQQLF